MRQLRLLLIMVVVMSMILPFNSSPVAAIGQPFEEGDIFAGVWLNHNGYSEMRHYRADTSFAGTLHVDEDIVPAYITAPLGMAFDQDGHLYVTGFGSRYIVKFDTNGNTVDYLRHNGFPIAVVFDASNHLYASFLHNGTLIKYDTDLNILDTFTLATTSNHEMYEPIYHLDFAPDQCTLFYTGVGNVVRRFNVCTNQQLPDFSTLPDQVGGVRVLYDGSVLVGSTNYIYRLDEHGTIFQLYSAAGVDDWNSIVLSPDSTSFWAGGDASIYRFSIESGDQLTSFSIGAEPMWTESLAIFSESCAFIQDCDRDGLSNYHETAITHTDPHNVDTDGDGLLDPWEVDPDPDGDGTRIPGAGFNLDSDLEIEVLRDNVFGPYADDQQDQEFNGYEDGRIPFSFPTFVRPPDPLRKDIYFELDWQDCSRGGCPDHGFQIDTTHHAPSLAGIRKVKDLFAQAPVDNPNDSTGINFHLLVDENLHHQPSCDQGPSATRSQFFGTEAQRAGNPATLEAKALVFRYVWSGHSTRRDDTSPCLNPGPFSFFSADNPLPFYDYSPFGDAHVGGPDILVSLGPLWICPSFNLTAGFVTSCFKDDGEAPKFMGIFPRTVYDDEDEQSTREFTWPLQYIIAGPNETETSAIARLWGRSLMHLIGHSLGLDDLTVRNDPSKNMEGGTPDTEPQPYRSWDNLKYAPDPTSPGTDVAPEAYPPQEVLHIANNPGPHIATAPTGSAFYYTMDIDQDGVLDGIDNCLMGIQNPDQADLDGDGMGDACDYDIDGDGQLNAVGANIPPTLDALPHDTNNDGVDNDASADDDGDGIADTLDICPFDADSLQLDNDGDGLGDVCDNDDDNDSFNDLIEEATGSSDIRADRVPEYIGRDASCTDGLDNDGDGQIDGSDIGCMDADHDGLSDNDDNCPNIANSGWSDRDKDGIGDACDPTPLPPNTAPTAAITGTYTVDEGSSITVAATGADAESSALNFLWDLNDDGTFGTIGQSVTLDTGDLAIDGPSAHPITVKVLDEWELSGTASTNVTVRNLAPVVGSISASKNPVMATSLLLTSADFTDAGVRDTHTAIWDWGDGTTSAGYVDALQGAGSAKGSHIYTTPGQYTVKLTVKDDDQASTQVMLQNVVVQPAPIVEYSTTALSVRENVSNVLVTVLLRSPSSETTTVDYTTSNGTATAGSDYYTASGTLTFAPGETLKTFTVQIENDTVDEANEIINLALSNPQHATLGPISTATITIEDDDVVPSVAFDLSKITVHENVGSINVEVELKSVSNNPITVDYTTGDGTATAGSDYTATSGTLTFAPGQSRQIFTVPIVEDTLGEPNETINLTLSNPTNATLGTTSSSIITINANDTLSFAGNVSVAEYAGSATMTVRLNAPSSSTVTVDYTTSNGTATAGSDYTATSGTLTFVPGETIKTFTVPIIDDVLGENTETVMLSLSNPTNATLSATPTATLTINGNDTLSFNGNVSVHENAGTATITVRLNGVSNLPVTVDYATNGGTATAGSDYTATSGTLTFAPGETAKTFTVAVLDDALGEANETVLLTLSNPTNAALSATPTATLTINANDTLSFNGNVSVHENAGTATITVKLSGPASQPVTIDYATNGGTATAGSDYTATSGTLTFAPGETSKTFTVAILEDALGESSETITLALSNPGNAVIGSPATATLTINANDTLSFSGNVSIHENAGSATITVKLSGPAGQPVTVDYTTGDNTATAGSDYTAASGTLTFAPGETSKTFTVAVLDDALGESNETVLLTLSNPTNAALSATPTATLTINANDALTFGASTYRVNESTASATITVKLSGPASQPVTVDYATSDGTATAGSDYTAATGSFTFAPGETSKTFVVPFINDTLDEPNETVMIDLSNPSSNAMLGSPATTVLTIVDND